MTTTVLENEMYPHHQLYKPQGEKSWNHISKYNFTGKQLIKLLLIQEGK